MKENSCRTTEASRCCCSNCVCLMSNFEVKQVAQVDEEKSREEEGRRKVVKRERKEKMGKAEKKRIQTESESNKAEREII